jgi:two-component system response regulator HydG
LWLRGNTSLVSQGTTLLQYGPGGLKPGNLHGVDRLQQDYDGSDATSSTLKELAKENEKGDAALVAKKKDLEEMLARAASNRAPVWISGESGTGKELAARAIHESGARSTHPFVAVNCAALPDNLIESELFGVERGAYTGAMKTRAGAFAQAHGGTLLLDEVGELSLTAQAKLLRVLELGEVQPVGSERTVKVDVRVLCASWRDLEAEVDAGRFRHDLLHRLWVLKVELPPLRERREDVPLLIRAMLERERSLHLFPKAAVIERLGQHDWPGNIRELRNCVTRAVAADDSAELMPRTKQPRTARSVNSRIDDAVLHTLARHRGNRRRTAQALGVSRSTLYRWLATGRVLPEATQPPDINTEVINLAS